MAEKNIDNDFDEKKLLKGVREHIDSILNHWDNWFKITELKTLFIANDVWFGEVTFNFDKLKEYNYKLILSIDEANHGLKYDNNFYMLRFYYYDHLETTFDIENIFTILYCDAMENYRDNLKKN